MSKNTTIERIKGDLKIKLIATLLLGAVVGFAFFFNPHNVENVLAALIVFGTLFVIFAIGICSDLRALKRYKKPVTYAVVYENFDKQMNQIKFFNNQAEAKDFVEAQKRVGYMAEAFVRVKL